MRPVQVRRFGAPVVLGLRELSDPNGPGQVVAAVAGVVLLVDTMIRAGKGPSHFSIRPLYVPGNGAVGTVAAVGDGVDRRWLGRTVVAHTGGPGDTGGAPNWHWPTSKTAPRCRTRSTLPTPPLPSTTDDGAARPRDHWHQGG
jgi:NADPH:quinone reductase-like Zn-dependent oxidoreductase